MPIVVDPGLRSAIDRIIKGVSDPEAIHLADELMKRMREEMRLRDVNVDLAGPLIDPRNSG